ncbi:glycosyltransferase family 2 protein [Nocardioides sp. LMS-CY]|uniref:glycosyltransferase family 2 protein n=1 Tax=Nocardioides sp. (strain LMS-CY) TaxID=2840457 RepID=UPI001C007CEC|nr:glycosyltransferase family 2 protein [Nocardioides sp. LMS-CY]QWF22526.1 glycosyltransferase family 2 protein [Nocardioides sp. LMS-CY]
MKRAVKLCAVAMNEGPYLADWIFHHLHFGFDAVEIWINGTDDPSEVIARRVSAIHPSVEFSNADGLLEACIAGGRYFQYEAYARMAEKAEADGFSHIAFLDLDEYWVPHDFVSPVREFLPDPYAVNVVSFPWAFDVADSDAIPFENAFASRLRIQMDHHVKSVVRLDDRVVQFRPHTARTRAGRRLLIRDRFPMANRRLQQWGSFIDFESLSATWNSIPEAYVLHRIHRSQVEYLASLRKAPRRVAGGSPYRDNRTGFKPLDRPVLRHALPPVHLASYLEQRAKFFSATGVGPATRMAADLTRARARQVVDDVVGDAALMSRLAGALRGVSEPALDRRYPGWHLELRGWVDEWAIVDRQLTARGWAFVEAEDQSVDLGVRDDRGEVLRIHRAYWTDRPDVGQVFSSAPVRCGFEMSVDLPASFGEALELVACPSGAGLWTTIPGSSAMQSGSS